MNSPTVHRNSLAGMINSTGDMTGQILSNASRLVQLAAFDDRLDVLVSTHPWTEDVDRS